MDRLAHERERLELAKQAKEETLKQVRDQGIKAMIEREKYYEAVVAIQQAPHSLHTLTKLKELQVDTSKIPTH